MSEHIFNLSLRVRQPSKAYRVRDAVRKFVDGQDGCRVMGCGRSCIDPTVTDIEIRVNSRRIAHRLLAAVRRTYADSCEVDCEVIA